MRSLLFSKNKKSYKDKLIRAWEGDEAGHTAVKLDNSVIDASLAHGVKKWDYEEWIHDKVLVDEIPVISKSQEIASIADAKLHDKLGRKYDLLKLLGFPLLRDLDDPDRDICSEVSASWFLDSTGIILPGRTGRVGVRLIRFAAASYYQGIST